MFKCRIFHFKKLEQFENSMRKMVENNKSEFSEWYFKIESGFFFQWFFS